VVFRKLLNNTKEAKSIKTVKIARVALKFLSSFLISSIENDDAIASPGKNEKLLKRDKMMDKSEKLKMKYLNSPLYLCIPDKSKSSSTANKAIKGINKG